MIGVIEAEEEYAFDFEQLSVLSERVFQCPLSRQYLPFETMNCSVLAWQKLSVDTAQGINLLNDSFTAVMLAGTVCCYLK